MEKKRLFNRIVLLLVLAVFLAGVFYIASLMIIRSCYDSDEGLNAFVAGEVGFVGGDKKFKDVCGIKVYDNFKGKEIFITISSCFGSNCFLREYYCTEDDELDSKLISCSKGCSKNFCHD